MTQWRPPTKCNPLIRNFFPEIPIYRASTTSYLQLCLSLLAYPLYRAIAQHPSVQGPSSSPTPRYFQPPINFRDGNIFSCVCHSVGGGPLQGPSPGPLCIEPCPPSVQGNGPLCTGPESTDSDTIKLIQLGLHCAGPCTITPPPTPDTFNGLSEGRVKCLLVCLYVEQVGIVSELKCLLVVCL